MKAYKFSCQVKKLGADRKCKRPFHAPPPQQLPPSAPPHVGRGRAAGHAAGGQISKGILQHKSSPTTSLSCAGQICTRRIAAFQSQATKGSGDLHTHKPL